MSKQKKIITTEAGLESDYKAGLKRPRVITGKIDPEKARLARIATTSSGMGRERTAGMMIDFIHMSAPYASGYKLDTYRSSYAFGLGDRTGAYDIPTYFLMMNQQNGGLLYWPVTLAEKYSWYRYWSRTDAYVARSLELLSDLPMSKLTLNMPQMPKEKKELQKEILEFFTYQMEVLNLFELCQDILWEWNMIGNCFKADTSIVTSRGIVPISEIRIGDLVLDASGNFSVVTTTARRYVEERLVSLKIAKMAGMEFSPTEEHPIFILRGNEEVMVKAREVRRGDWVGMGCVAGIKDVDSVAWRIDLDDYLRKFYIKGVEVVTTPRGEMKCHYEVPTGTSVNAAEVRDALLSWISALKEPTVADCSEVSEQIGVSDAVRIRSVAYALRKRGEIKVERTSKGKHGGSSLRWYPLDNPVDYGHMREMDISFPVIADETIEVDEDFMYLLGYWLGDGWLWSAKNKFAKEFEGFDICVSDECLDLFARVDSVARSVFGSGAVDNEPFVPDSGMKHVTVKDPLLAAWWNTQFGHDCKTKRLPGWVMELPPEKLIWLLRGMIDSDGFVSRKESGCVAGMVGTNKNLMLQLFHISLTCGLPVSFSRQDSDVVLPNGKMKSSVMWLVSIGKRGYYEKLVDGCYKALVATWSDNEEVNPTFRLKDGKFYYRVDAVERPFYSGYVYNFEVDGSHTYCANGVKTHNCYVFHEWDDDKKMWSRAVMLPPEEVYIFQYPFSENRRVEYRPERLIRMMKDGAVLVAGQSALADSTSSLTCARGDLEQKILEHIPEEIVEMVRTQGCIVMDSDPMTGSFVHHFARRRSRYLDLGASVLERVLVQMLCKENFRYTQLSLATRNMTPKNLITAPGLMPTEVDELRTQVDLSYMDPEYSIITNYEVNWQQIGTTDRLLDLDREYERLENQVFAGLGVTRELLTGEGTFGGSKITVEILNTMFLMTRELIKSYIEKKLFIPVCEAHGWYETGKSGIKKYLYPQLGFNRLTIRDNTEVFDSLFQLYQKGSLPVDIIYELFNLNVDEINAKLRSQLFTVKDATSNRMSEEVNAEVGRKLVDLTDIVPRVAKYLGLKMKSIEEQQQAQGMGGMGVGFADIEAPAGTPPTGTQEGVPVGPAEGEVETEAPEEESEPVPTEEESESGRSPEELDAVADAVSKSMPSKFDDGDIEKIVEKVSEKEGEKKASNGTKKSNGTNSHG